MYPTVTGIFKPSLRRIRCPVATAQFKRPEGVVVDAAGNIYVVDKDNHKIRKITSGGLVSTFAGSTKGYADGTGAAAKFDHPQGIAVDNSDNIYVGDAHNHRIRKISPAGVVTTLAGSFKGDADGGRDECKF